MEAYSHHPLDRERDIRIIRLEGSDVPNSPLQLELVEASLDSPPEYFAVSYCWDGQSPDRSIVCEGKNLLVTANCEGALQRFRPSANQNVFLWIDAICINQSVVDNDERNHQVSLMGEIYASADQVWVWLGSQKLKYLPQKDVDILKFLQALAFAASNEDPNEAEARITELVYTVDLVDLRAIRGKIPWFTRLWVVQEVALSKAAVLFWDDIEIPFQNLCKAFGILRSDPDILSRRSHAGSVLNACLGKLYNAFRCRINAMAGETVNAVKILTMGLTLYTSKPEDRVFAIHSFLNLTGLGLPPPDYSKSTAEIYHEATSAVLKHTNDISVLKKVTGINQVPGLLSWVPDWSIRARSTPFAGGNGNTFSASRYSHSSFTLDENDSFLSVKGRIVDTILCHADLSFVSSSPGLNGEPPGYLLWREKFFEPSDYHRFGLILNQVWNVRVLQNSVLFAHNTASTPAGLQQRIEIYTCFSSAATYYSVEDVPKDLPLWDKWQEAFMQFEPSWKDFPKAQPLSASNGGKLHRGLVHSPSYFTRIGRWLSLKMRNTKSMAMNNPQLSRKDSDSSVTKSLPLTHGEWLQNRSSQIFDLMKGSSVLSTYECKGYKAILHDVQNASFQAEISAYNYNQKLFRTVSGNRLGMASHSIQVGDKVVLFAGLDVPMIVRPGGKHFKLICPAFVHGIMYGEAWGDESGLLQDIVLT